MEDLTSSSYRDKKLSVMFCAFFVAPLHNEYFIDNFLLFNHYSLTSKASHKAFPIIINDVNNIIAKPGTIAKWVSPK
jgi:hypothetical protein